MRCPAAQGCVQREFHNRTPVYFTNDDHDILRNDSWPEQSYGSLTWDEGLAIFAEQTPSSPLPYRAFRHGHDLEIWVIEGRHWQYFSIDPATGLREFGCGPMSDLPAGGYTPQPGDEAEQKFFSPQWRFSHHRTKPEAGTARLSVRHDAVDSAVTHEVVIESGGTLQMRRPR